MQTQAGDRYIVISADGHAGAQMHEYRPYLDKKYLADLARAGVPLVPTIWIERISLRHRAASDDPTPTAGYSITSSHAR